MKRRKYIIFYDSQWYDGGKHMFGTGHANAIVDELISQGSQLIVMYEWHPGNNHTVARRYDSRLIKLINEVTEI